MKKLEQVIAAVSAVPAYVPEGWEGHDVNGVFASDLISDILVSEGERVLLLTSLQTDQVLRAADVIGAAGVILVNRNGVSEVFVKAAAEKGIPVFYTSLPKFESCVRLGKVLEPE